ncbi:phage tail sheath subtilisin-like domain-containing protein [Reichenbachiella carrageenanivorans]|uniref:Phage tail sheath subtilisin-like domain-containing protein n=1 Tax=Reichenbachiella carrageenanivorans TaxID=2979869 RepID=A0ABY6CUZ0_9BACT|nr:phage tail sheath C-terminal domain-containing protein [Reichenbachiella carrageenanivorans]UXX77729.1 phage tail sheath subtilisin-like domain-containing protein [Reichenbachiella carrageenanivorans]
MAINLATPGVYIEELNAFPNTVAGIPTSVPAFVGYTEKTSMDGRSLINEPVKISSMSDYIKFFGEGTKTKYKIEESDDLDASAVTVAGKGYNVVPESSSRFILFDSMRLYFANGGGTCWVVTVGSYTTTPKAAKGPKGESAGSAGAPLPTVISKKALIDGIQSLVKESEPSILVVPESVMLSEGDCFSVQQDMLSHCGFKMKDRFAILDVHKGSEGRTNAADDVIDKFRAGIGLNQLAYGAAYYPWVHTTIVDADEVDLTNISNLDVLATVLSKEADVISETPKKSEEVKNELKKLTQKDLDVESTTQMLNVVSPLFKKIQNGIRSNLNILPPAAGMAGVYCMVDNERGIWKAPANVSINSVTAPTVRITHEEQQDLNVTVSGKSINAIRAFVGDGTTVWGARTLDGNSGDWKYINVRRTVTFIEQSIKGAAKKYVYEPNTANTWVLMKSMISSFLNGIWRQGGLVGLTPDQAYDVQVGVGANMTTNDVLDGIMRISVKIAVSRPAEFIVITFQQKMQEL